MCIRNKQRNPVNVTFVNLFLSCRGSSDTLLIRITSEPICIWLIYVLKFDINASEFTDVTYFLNGTEMDTVTPSEGKTTKNTKRGKKRGSTDSEKKTNTKSDEVRDKPNQSALYSDGDNGQENSETSVTDGPADGCSGDSSNREPLSMDSLLNLILSQKKKELLECPEVVQFIKQSSRDT